MQPRKSGVNNVYHQRFKTPQQKFDEKYGVDDQTGCWNWKKTSGRRYGNMHYDGTAQQAHRVSWQLHRGPIPDGLHVLHRCDNTKCVNPDHLFLGTRSDNMVDMVAKGRDGKAGRLKAGEGHHNAKLREVDVINIRAIAKHVPTATVTALANIYDISRTQMGRIIRGERWQNAH